MLNIDDYGNVFMIVGDYEFMYSNEKMYVRTRINANVNEPFDYTDVMDLINSIEEKCK